MERRQIFPRIASCQRFIGFWAFIGTFTTAWLHGGLTGCACGCQASVAARWEVEQRICPVDLLRFSVIALGRADWVSERAKMHLFALRLAKGMPHIQVLSAISGGEIGAHNLLATYDGVWSGDDTEGLPKEMRCCLMHLSEGLEPLLPVQQKI